MKLASDAFAIRNMVISAAQIELFSEYKLPPTIHVRNSNTKKSIHKKIDSVTIDEVREYISQHYRHPQIQTTIISELTRLLNDAVSNGAKGSDKLIDAYEKIKKTG
jgi:ethanolamine ammonia-lyase large subunit